MKKLAVVLQEIPLIFASVILFLMMALTFADVVMRSALNSPVEASTELIKIAMAVIVFSVLPVVSWRRQHITVDLLDRFFSPLLSKLRDALISLLCGIILFFPAQRIVVLAERAVSYGDVTEYLGIPQSYIAWMIAVMTFITACLLVLRGLVTLFTPATVSDDSKAMNGNASD